MGGVADIGIRVFLDNAATIGLNSITGGLSNMTTMAGGAGNQLRQMEQIMNAVRAGAVIGFGAALMGAGAAIGFSVEQAALFQDAMFKVAVATHVSFNEAMQFKDQMFLLGSTSKFTTAEIAQGIATLGQRGFSLKDIMNTMAQAAIYLGEATGTKAVDAFNLLGQTMRAFNIPASEAAKTADLLQYGFEHGVPSVLQLSTAISTVASQASLLHIPLREVVAALDTMTPAMGTGGTAATALRYMMQALFAPLPQAKKMLADLGIIITTETGPAFQKFANDLLKTGTVNADFIKLNEHSVTGLNALFVAAQKAGMIGLDKDFSEWALQTGFMSSKFYDAKGHAMDFAQVVQMLHDKLKGLPDSIQKADLAKLFNTRSGAGAAILLGNIDLFKQKLDELVKSNDNQGVSAKRAADAMGNWHNAQSALSTSIADTAAVIGLQFLPFMTPMLQNLNGLISSFRHWADANKGAVPAMLVTAIAISAIGLAIAGTLLLMAHPVFAVFIGSALAAIAIVALLSAAVPFLIKGWQMIAPVLKPVTDAFQHIGSVIGPIILNTLHMLGNVLMSVLMPTFAAIGNDMKTQLVPAWHQLVVAVTPFLPLLRTVGMIIGVVVVAAILGLIAALVALVGGVAVAVRFLLMGISQIIVGMILFSAGVYNILHGVVNLFQAAFLLITGHTGEAGAMWNQAWSHIGTGILQIITGALHAILGVFIAVFGTIIGFFIGFFTTVTGIFHHLSDVLVGHSIIPDMMNAIAASIMGGLSRALGMFTSWVGGVGSTVSSLPSKIMGAIASLGTMLYNSGQTAMQMFANGLGSAIGAVVSQVQNAAQQVANFLQHKSPAKMGPLAEDDKWMPNMMNMMVSGIAGGIPAISTGARNVASTIGNVPNMVRANGLGGSASGGQQQTSTTVNLLIDSKVVSTLFLNNLTGQLQLNGLGRAMR